MSYTRHGHHIPNTTVDDELGQIEKRRCGGVHICPSCHLDALYSLTELERPFEDVSEYAYDPDRFLKQAKLYVIGAHNNRATDREATLKVEDLYIVWFTKTLMNWKALISTSKPGDGLYFEVTYNGEKEETYVDTYRKISNDKFSQEGQ